MHNVAIRYSYISTDCFVPFYIFRFRFRFQMLYRCVGHQIAVHIRLVELEYLFCIYRLDMSHFVMQFCRFTKVRF